MIAILAGLIAGLNIGFIVGAWWASRDGRPDRMASDNRAAVSVRMLHLMR